MKPLTVIIAVLVIIAAVFTFGYSQGRKSVKLEQFKEYREAVKARDKLQTELNDKDTALITVQQQLADKRDKEVIKYVTVYRDRTKDPVVAQCVRDSGLLDVYDATVSTAVK